MFETIYNIISVLTAIFTALLAYRFVMEYHFRPIVTAAIAIGIGIVAGGIWLPSVIILCIILFAERKNAYHE